MAAHALAALVFYLSNQMEGPTFQNNFQLGANFLYHLCALILLNVHKVNPERISKACPQGFCSKFFVVAFVSSWASSWANLKTNLGSYTPGNLQLQATVSSNISSFLARLQPLHLDHDYVGKGRSNVSKSTLFIQEACSSVNNCFFVCPVALHFSVVSRALPLARLALLRAFFRSENTSRSW